MNNNSQQPPKFRSILTFNYSGCVAPLVLALLTLLFYPVSLNAQVFLAKDEALELAFPGDVEVETLNFVLTAEQADHISVKARTRVTSKIVTFFRGILKDGSAGYAFIDTTKIRTNFATSMIILSATGSVRDVVVLAFYEPKEYIPSDGWFDQFVEKNTKDSLRIDQEIHGILGSTLSVRGLTGSVAKALATFDELGLHE